MCVYIFIHLGKKFNAFKGYIVNNQTKVTYGRLTLRLVGLVVTSDDRKLLWSGC